MLKEFLRIVALVLLIIIAAMDDFPFYQKMKDPFTQLILAVIIIILIFYDVTFGFIMGIVLLLIYYEIYSKIIKIHQSKYDIDTEGENIIQKNKCVEEMEYISKSHLLSAQNNIVNVNNFNSIISGINEGYSVQGLNMGYDANDKYSVL
jgi:hypothetical protein